MDPAELVVVTTTATLTVGALRMEDETTVGLPAEFVVLTWTGTITAAGAEDVEAGAVALDSA